MIVKATWNNNVSSPNPPFNFTQGKEYTLYNLADGWFVKDDGGVLVSALTPPPWNGGSISNPYWTLVSITSIEPVQIYP